MKIHLLFSKMLMLLAFTGALTWGSLSSVYAQVATNYNFSQNAGSYSPITGTLVAEVTGTAGAAALDDVTYTLASGTIPFTFNYDGNGYTGLNINTNGFITFGSNVSNTYAPISSASNYSGVIAAFARDMQGGFVTAGDRTSGSNLITNVSDIGPAQVGNFITGTGIPAGTTITAISGNTITISANATSTGTIGAIAFFGTWANIRYETIGSAPNRTFVIQYSNFRRFGTTLTTVQNMFLNFQIRLNETDNSIEVVYGNCSPGLTTFTTVNEVGLRGATNAFATNVNNRRNIKGTNDNWNASTQGIANNSGMLFNNVAPANVIPTGLTYRWELASCIAPSGLAASLVSLTEANLSWNAAVPTPGVGYEWAVTTSPTPPASGTFTAGLTANDNTLVANTTYYLHVRSECSIGVFSGWSTFMFSTLEGNSCSFAQDLSLLSSPYSGTTVGFTDNFNLPCIANTAVDRIFRIDVPAGNVLFIGQSVNGYDSKHRVAYGGACPGTTEINTGYLGNFPTQLTTGTIAGCLDDNDLTHYYFNNNTGMTQTVYWLQDGFSSGQGTFTLEWQIIAPSPPPGCASNFVYTPTPNCANYPGTISWDAVGTASGYRITIGTTPGGNDVANNVNLGNVTSYTLTAPALNTTYYYTVTPFNIGGDATGCLEQTFTTGTQGCACIPIYTSGKTLGDLISNVEIPGTTLANNSGTAQVNPAFTYFTGLPNYTADLQAGTTYSVNVTVGTWGNQHIRAWIDYNDDGVFDNSESIGNTIIAPGQGNTGPFPPASFNISLACNPPVGVHRMRIRSVWQGTANPAFAAAIDPCISYGFGETEDYDVNVLAPPPCPSITNLVVSNITQNTADISWTAGCVETGWDISVTTDPTPGAPIETNYGSTNYTILNLDEATTYWVHVRANCGVDGESSWTTTSFTTNPPLPACTNAPTITNLAPCSTPSIQASWAAVPLADGYNIYLGTASGVYDIANPFFNAAPEVFLNNPVAGQTYYFLIVPTNLTGEAIGCIEYSHTAPDVCPPPANDLICDALDVTNAGQQDLNTYAFLADMTCNNQLGTNQLGTAGPVGPNCGGSNGPDVWYTFTTPGCNVGGTVPFQIELTTNNPGTFFDTKLALYSSSDNTCSGVLTQIACNDDNLGAGNPAICGTGGGFSSTLVVSNLLPNTQYWIYIGGFNGAVGTFELSGRALTPAHAVATTGNGTQIQLTTADMGAGLYTYYYKQVGSPGYSTFNSPSALTDTRTLAAGNSYQTQIMYRCGANFDQSQWYRTAPQTTVLESVCALVNDMTCTFNGPNSYTLTWTQPSGELFTNNGALSGYRIKRNPVGSTGVFTFSNPAVVCVDGTCSVTLPGNSPTGFNWTIETRCSANTVQVGNTTSCGPAPEMTLGNNANNNTDKSTQHTFSFVNAEAGIEFVDVQMHDAYADFGLNTPMIGDYEMYVNSKNEITWRRVDASVDMNFDFIIVPNPSNAMTTVHLNTVVEAGTFTIVDAMGRTINSGAISNTDNVNIDAAQLQSGVYMVVVTVGNQQLTRRLVVAN